MSSLHKVVDKRPIPEGYAMVEVDEAVHQYHHVEVDYPIEEGAKTIWENEHIFIIWEKAYIVFPPGTYTVNLYSPRHLRS